MSNIINPVNENVITNDQIEQNNTSDQNYEQISEDEKNNKILEKINLQYLKDRLAAFHIGIKSCSELIWGWWY